MCAETLDSGICETCPLAELENSEVARASREWAFARPYPHEGFQDPRFPALGMMAMHYGSLCRSRSMTGACKLDAPEMIARPTTGESF